MRKTTLANTLFSALLCIAALFLQAQPLSAALNGNTDAAHARFITADGAAYADTVTNVNTQTWFVVPISHDHSYEIVAWAPSNNVLQLDPATIISVREADGTTLVAVSGSGANQPEVWDTVGPNSVGGDRRTLANTGSGTARQIKIRVIVSSGAPSVTVPFNIRVIDTTQMAARWTVNGYQAFFALNNLSDDAVSTGFIIYYSQIGAFLASDPFTMNPNGSVQIVKANSVLVGGQFVGGVRLLFTDGSAGQVRAQEYNYNAVSGQYLTFDFGPVFQSAAGVQF